MENIDKLKEIWQEDNKNAEKYYNDNKEEILNKAQQKANDIISKVKRNIRKDYIINIVAIPIIVFWLKTEGFSSFTLIKQINIIFLIGAMLGVYLYWTILLQKQLKKGDLIGNVMDSINFRINVLSKFIKRAKILSYVSYLVVVILVIYIKPYPITSIFEGWTAINYILYGFVILLMLAFLYVVHVVSMAIYDSFYGNHLKYLKSLRDELVREISDVQ